MTQIHRPARLATRAASFRYGGRHHSGIPGGIIPLYPGGFVVIRKLAAGDWINRAEGLLVTGPTGVGKSWIACALGHKACRENLSVLYARMPRLFADLAIAHGDARYARLLRSLARVKLLILDDWGPEALTPEQARDLLEIVEDRYDKGSIIITSQVPVDRWHDLIGIPTLADAILDRVIHNAYRIDLAGESLRKRPSSS